MTNFTATVASNTIPLLIGLAIYLPAVALYYRLVRRRRG